MNVVILYNEPQLAAEHRDAASEAGVLESVDAVAAALAAHGHRSTPVPLPPAPGEAAQRVLRLPQSDVVFNLVEGFGGVGHGEAEIAGLVELTGHPLTGSPADCLALVRNKARTKWLLTGAGVPTAEFLLVSPGDEIDAPSLRRLLDGKPLIVKPAYEDASLGIDEDSIVLSLERLEQQIDQVHRRYGPALVERFIAGREFNVGVLALPEADVLPLAEIEFATADWPERRIVTYAAKWDPASPEYIGTPVTCPAVVTPELADELRQVALEAFRLTGCRDYARIDLRVDDRNRPYVLEVNANPDIGPGAGLARAIATAGIAYDDFIERLVTTARSRQTAVTP